ncbi:K(+)-transporting ATPase subunit C [Desulfomonile tiedjei]|uniref:Potassium-transporting ATPase KdpC subunit n=1 Tax=Desulfomonile tiedjei (strain ATCC 49306 / DSM 6799 / DCB-1) TaxID=706587 RepID=I4C4T6_DESTA|nr:K(+)-transporting ATPase subunit C [Desulfomonile tiedjei]AFM24577.1 K+-transporting ATPase, C subunit [Desulfomonile tiedjei DSM 6799]
MKTFIRELRVSIIATIALGIILCGIYPLVVWGIAQVFFPHQANGSLIVRNGKIVGSELLGQNFVDAKYFHPRPSSTGENGYDASSSGGSNLGPTSKKLVQTVKERIEAYRAENGLSADVPIPADAVTASASGLDPHITLENARLQASRVARARGIDESVMLEKLRASLEGRDLRILGEPRINVTKLNLSLDEMK